MIDIVKAGYHGILLPQFDIGFDYSGKKADYVFISHAHADHMPRRRSLPVYATENTIRLMRRRCYSGSATALPFGKTLHTPKADVTLFPAGHILGSAMVYVETDEGSVLYTGDYKTPPSPASEGFQCPPKVDHFITEATFSLPIYKWPPQKQLINQVQNFATEALADNHTPIYLAYSLGKAQELMHMLAPAELPVQIHEAGFKLCDVYDDAGVDLGLYNAYDPDTCEGKVLITPASGLRNGFASHITRRRIAYCSGWAVSRSARNHVSADTYIPLSDHLDFFELIRLCKELHPQKTYITHTPNAEVVRHYLDNIGIDSVFLDA